MWLRAAMLQKRGSSQISGLPTAGQNLRQCRSRIGHHAQIAVLGLVRPAPGAGDARIAERSHRRHEVVAEQMLGEHERHQLLEHRDFDELAAAGFLARQQGDRNGVGDRQRGDLVGQDGRRVARLAADRHQGGDAGLALDDVVIGRLAAIGPAVAVAVQRRIDQARIARAHRLMREAELFDLLRPHRMHENVGAGDQPPQRVRGRGLLEIEHQRALAAVEPHEQRRHVRRARRAGVARRIALGRLDLDDVGAHVAEHLRRQRPGDHRSQIENANAR